MGGVLRRVTDRLGAVFAVAVRVFVDGECMFEAAEPFHSLLRKGPTWEDGGERKPSCSRSNRPIIIPLPKVKERALLLHSGDPSCTSDAQPGVVLNTRAEFITTSLLKKKLIIPQQQQNG